MNSAGMAKRTFEFRSIGVVRSPFQEAKETPIQPIYAGDARGQVELFPEYADGLMDLEGFSHLHLIYVFDRAGRPQLRVRPFLQDVEHGVFATRSPLRPNAIGTSIVRLLRREGAVLHVAELDLLDGTPLLDIKPFAPRFDVRQDVRAGWMDQVDEATARQRGARAGRNPDQK